MNGLTLDGTAEPVPRDQILRRDLENAGGPSEVNVIETQLRGLINSGLTRCWLTVTIDGWRPRKREKSIKCTNQSDSACWVWRMSGLTLDGTAEPVPRDQILRRERGLGKYNFPCSADREQDWQSSRLTLLCVMTIHTYRYIYTYILLYCTISCGCGKR